MSVVERRPDRTLGPGHDTFWAWCDQEALHLPRCTRCGILMWPIEPACTTCAGTGFVWEQLSGHGTIVSWCTFEHDYYQGLLPLPWRTILVELDEGPLFVSNPHSIAARDMRAGLPVRVAFLPCEDGAGRFNLPVFAPVPADCPSASSLSSEEVVS